MSNFVINSILIDVDVSGVLINLFTVSGPGTPLTAPGTQTQSLQFTSLF